MSRLGEQFVALLVGRLFGWMVDGVLFVGWLASCLVGWSDVWLGGWIVGRLVGWPFVCLFVFFVLLVVSFVFGS